jgi:hypothetical protein
LATPWVTPPGDAMPTPWVTPPDTPAPTPWVTPPDDPAPTPTTSPSVEIAQTPSLDTEAATAAGSVLIQRVWESVFIVVAVGYIVSAF